MPLTFNADEIFAMAEQIERNGARFYREAARLDLHNQKLLLTLAKQEDQHLATFSAMRQQLTSAEKEPVSIDPDNEAGLYLQAMADQRVFTATKAAASLTGRESPRDILDIALGKETDSIVFYVGLKELVPAHLGQDKLMAITREELRHIAVLRTAAKTIAN